MLNNVNDIENKPYSASKALCFGMAPSAQNAGSNTASFQTNTSTVNTTPAQDTYTQAVSNEPKEMSMGQKFLYYMLPTGLALNYASTLFNKANKGDYEKSLLGKLGNFGDRLSDSKFIKNSFVDKLKSIGSSIKTKAGNFVNKHATLNTMRDMHTNPECVMVKGFLETQTQADLKEAVDKLEKFIEKGPKSLKEAGATKDEIKAIKASGQDLKTALKEFEIKKMGFDPKNIPAGTALKDLRMQYLGLNDISLGMLKQAPEKYKDTLEEVLKDAKKVSPKMSTYLNKLLSISAPKSKLGRLFPKMAKLGMRGLTFGGGFFNSLFVGFVLGDAVKNTVDAPKGQKLATGINGLFDAVSWIVAMPLALKAMHAIGGLKNLGTTKAQHDAYMKAFNEFKENAKSKYFDSPEEYNKAWEKVDKLKKACGKPKGFFKKILRKIGQFLSIGLEQKPIYEEVTNGKISKVLGNWGRKIRHHLPKNAIGYPLRFALYAFAFQPIVDKIFKAPLEAVFGKPYDPEKIKEEKEKEQRLKEEQNPQQTPQTPQTDTNKLADSNLIKQTVNGQTPNPQVQTNNQPQNNNNQNGKMEPVRTYIPSPVGYVEQQPDMSPANMALANADKAEQEISQIMAAVRKS